jgi:CarD family transcriptional regulator
MSSTDNKFKKGDSIILGNYGAGIIQKVSVEKILDQKNKFFQIKLLSSEMQIQIPVIDIDEAGARKPSSKQKLNKVLKMITGKVDKATEREIKKRYEDGIESIDNSDIDIVSEMMYYFNKKGKLKPLSMNEKKQFNQLLSLFAGEYAVSNNIDYHEAYQKVYDKLKK